MCEQLTIKQQIFVDTYQGNATGAAREAGYKSPEVEGHRLLRNAKIAKALAKRTETPQEADRKRHILTREERQQFWSDVTTGNIVESYVDHDGNDASRPAALRERIKASELLGKSQADFIERKVVTAEVGVTGTVNLPEIQELILKYVSTD